MNNPNAMIYIVPAAITGAVIVAAAVSWLVILSGMMLGDAITVFIH